VKANFGYYDDFIVSGSEDNRVHLWDVKSQKHLGVLGRGDMQQGHIDIVNEVVWNTPNTIISSSDDMSVIVWNVLS
jgi:WD40 repeat protein